MVFCCQVDVIRTLLLPRTTVWLLCPSGGVDKGLCPSIGSLRPGSVAQRCDALCAGDRVTAVNGISTSRLKHDEIVSLLRGVEDRAVLELAYPLPSFRKSSVADLA
jgi:hypothetical protein